MLTWPGKDPADVTDFAIDGWIVHLGSSDSVSTATWSATPSGLTLGASSVTEAGDKTSVWIESGASGTTYTVTCRAVSAGGRTMDRSALLLVTDR